MMSSRNRLARLQRIIWELQRRNTPIAWIRIDKLTGMATTELKRQFSWDRERSVKPSSRLREHCGDYNGR